MLGESSTMLMERFRRKIEDQTRTTLQFQNFTIVDMLLWRARVFTNSSGLLLKSCSVMMIDEDQSKNNANLIQELKRKMRKKSERK